MPTVTDAKVTTQKVINRYNADKGGMRKVALFKPAYSPFMQALLNWHRNGETLSELESIIALHYKSYFTKRNFREGNTGIYGVGLSFKCLVACDNELFNGGVCSQILGPEINKIPRSYNENNILDRLSKAGLLHSLPDTFLKSLKQTNFFTNFYSFKCRNTALAWAIANGAFQTAKKLIALAPLEGLMIQDSYGGKGILSFLVAKGSSYIPDTYDTSIKEGSVKAVFDTLMSRKDLTHHLIDQKDHQGNTPLHIAFLRRDRHMIQVLVDKGADITETNHQGLTPIKLYETKTPREAYDFISRIYFDGVAKLGFVHDLLARRVPDDDLSDLIQHYSKSPVL